MVQIANRKRALSGAGKLSKRSILMLASALGIVGLLAFSGFFWDILAIRKVVIEGGERITIDDVQSLINVSVGDNIVFADLEAAQARLMAHPWVRAASVERRYPNVHIAFQERHPYAVISIPESGLMWCDEEGYILYPYSQSEQEQTTTLMTVEGLGAVKQRANGLQVGGDLQWRLVRAVKRSATLGNLRPSRIRFFSDWLDVATQTGQTIRLPLERTENALRRLTAIWPDLIERVSLKTLDLRFDGELVYEGALHQR